MAEVAAPGLIGNTRKEQNGGLTSVKEARAMEVDSQNGRVAGEGGSWRGVNDQDDLVYIITDVLSHDWFRTSSQVRELLATDGSMLEPFPLSQSTSSKTIYYEVNERGFWITDRSPITTEGQHRIDAYWERMLSKNPRRSIERYTPTVPPPLPVGPIRPRPSPILQPTTPARGGKFVSLAPDSNHLNNDKPRNDAEPVRDPPTLPQTSSPAFIPPQGLISIALDSPVNAPASSSHHPSAPESGAANALAAGDKEMEEPQAMESERLPQNGERPVVQGSLGFGPPEPAPLGRGRRSKRPSSALEGAFVADKPPPKKTRTRRKRTLPAVDLEGKSPAHAVANRPQPTLEMIDAEIRAESRQRKMASRTLPLETGSTLKTPRISEPTPQQDQETSTNAPPLAHPEAEATAKSPSSSQIEVETNGDSSQHKRVHFEPEFAVEQTQEKRALQPQSPPDGVEKGTHSTQPVASGSLSNQQGDQLSPSLLGIFSAPIWEAHGSTYSPPLQPRGSTAIPLHNGGPGSSPSLCAGAKTTSLPPLIELPNRPEVSQASRHSAIYRSPFTAAHSSITHPARLPIHIPSSSESHPPLQNRSPSPFAGGPTTDFDLATSLPRGDATPRDPWSDFLLRPGNAEDRNAVTQVSLDLDTPSNKQPSNQTPSSGMDKINDSSRNEVRVQEAKEPEKQSSSSRNHENGGSVSPEANSGGIGPARNEGGLASEPRPRGPQLWGCEEEEHPEYSSIADWKPLIIEVREAIVDSADIKYGVIWVDRTYS